MSRLKKRIRIFLYRLQWWLTENTAWTPKRPLHVDLELTNYCNLKCTMCPHGQGWAPEKGFMDVALAKKVIDECVSLKIPSMKFQFRGESGLHPDVIEIVKYAKDKGILEAQLNTNAIAWSEARIEALAEAGLDRVIISIDGGTRETYEAIRQGAKWTHLIRAVHWFHLRPWKVRIQLTCQPENENEIPQFKTLFTPLCDELIIKPVRHWNTGERKPCPQPRQRLVIGWNGKAYGCCHAWNEESYLQAGAVHNSVENLWKFNAMMRDKARDPNKGEPCRTCQVRSSYR